MRISRYAFLIKDQDDYYAYSTLSNSLLDIDKEAYNFLKSIQNSNGKLSEPDDLDETFRKVMIENKILTDSDEDDYLLFKSQIMQLRAQRESMHLTLAPTMDCCFNCHYCFEKVKGGDAMSESVMDAIVKYVSAHKELKSLRVTWFGGEPLMAVDSIWTMYEKLVHALPDSIKYSSNIITSGYHLDNKAVDILRKVKVSSIQVTIDGLKETHNKVKFLSECKDVFGKVIDNIDNASIREPDMSIVIRVNLTLENAHEYPELYKYVLQRFKGRKNVSIVPAFVLDRNSEPSKCQLFTRKAMAEYIFKLTSLNIDSPFIRYPKPYFTECAIRNANAVSFDPEGHAYKCWENIGNKDYAVWKLNEDGIPVDVNIKLLNRHMYGADPFDDPVCAKCTYLPICGGGCPLQRIENKFEGKHNDLCTCYKGNIKDFMKIHIERKKAGLYNY